jgi:hypothetical protein
MKATCIALVFASLAGCAAPPGTPGAGVGKNYTPIIDTQGVNQERYTRDLADCRQFAGIIDAEKAALQGMIGGMIVGALIGSAYGGSRNTQFGANYGAGAGLGGVAAKATNTQEKVMINCMAGRGYRTLDGSAQASTSYPSPYGPQTAMAAAPAGMVVSAAPAQPVIQNLPAPTSQNSTTALTTTPTGGRDKFQAEKFAVANACAPIVVPWIAGMGVGFETYSASCGATSQIIRCEFGNCRFMQ